MPTLVLSLFRFAATPLQWSWRAVAMENTALRVQLVAFQRKRKQPILTCVDRLFWVAVPCCGRAGAHPWFTSKPTRSSLGARTVSQVLGSAVESEPARSRPTHDGRRDSTSHRTDGCRQPLWGAPRIHGELKVLGIEISERTVSRILRRLLRPRPAQTWKTFLRKSPRSDGFD
jgi:putative transposase